MPWQILVRVCGKSEWHLIALESEDLARASATIMRGRGFEVLGPCRRPDWSDLHPLLRPPPDDRSD